jgi:hypothetical protein
MSHFRPLYPAYVPGYEAIPGSMLGGQTASATSGTEMSEWTMKQSSPVQNASSPPTPDHEGISGRTIREVDGSLGDWGAARHHSCLYAWSSEIMCCLIGIAAMIGFYFYPLAGAHADSVPLAGNTILLVWVNGKPQPNLPIHLTVNSLVELITSIAKFALAVPIVSGLGQLKWRWYKAKPRPLTDFQLHENASHGGLGSLRLLFTPRLLRESSVIVSV